MPLDLPRLAALGWNQFFHAQLPLDDEGRLEPVRVLAVHRGRLVVAGPDSERSIPSRLPAATEESQFATVGDWLLVDSETRHPVAILERASVFTRKAPGTAHGIQHLAANVDTTFVVSSCNADFNVARLERYLVLVRDAGVVPVVVLTKADLADDPAAFAAAARALLPGLAVETVNALDSSDVARLAPWCGPGQTVALLGSSGVGKSTLVNTLTGEDRAATHGIREADGRGRHTTTGRALHRLADGGWLLDTPGMRELQLAGVESGLADVFDDLTTLATACRFSDCRHGGEPGCAIQQALDDGTLDPSRLRRWRKLDAEQARNSETLAQRHARDRTFGKLARTVLADKYRQRNGG